MTGYGTIVRNDLRILRRDPVFAITYVVMPVITMVVLKGMSRSALEQQGFAQATGAEHAVTGATVLFAFFLVGNVGMGVFREHGWNTWVRLRASPATSLTLILAKGTVPLALLATQMTILISVGLVLLDLRVRGSWVGLVLVLAAFGACLGGLGFALLGVCRSVQQRNAFASVGTILLGAVGGAIAPVQTLPSWLRPVSKITPTYWAMDGLQEVTLRSGGLADVLPAVAVLLGFASVFGVIAARRIRVTEVKLTWA